MCDNVFYVISGYFISISLLAIALCVYDKHASKSGLRRIRERTLMLVCVLGGAAAMLITMRRIRHKTKHAKFMIGIPAIIMLQIVIVFICWLLKGGSL